MATSTGSTALTTGALSTRILRAPDPRLRVKTKQIKKITPELLKLAREMIKLASSFTDPEGVGLSSTQIGRGERFFVAKFNGNFEAIFNPEIISSSQKNKTYFEGCLSVPDYYGDTIRPIGVRVSYINEDGQRVEKKLAGTSAWIFQHEFDHINGILFVDRVLEQKGKMYKYAGKDKTDTDVFEEVKLV